MYCWIKLMHLIYFPSCAVKNVKWIAYQPKTHSLPKPKLFIWTWKPCREFSLQWSFWCSPYHLKCPWSERRKEENRIEMFSVYGYSASLSDIISAVESLDQFNSFTNFYYFLRWNLSEQRCSFLQLRGLFIYIFLGITYLFCFSYFSGCLKKNWRLLSSPLKCLDVFWMLHQDQGLIKSYCEDLLCLFRQQKYVLFIFWLFGFILAATALDAGIVSSIPATLHKTSGLEMNGWMDAWILLVYLYSGKKYTWWNASCPNQTYMGFEIWVFV